MSSDFYLTITSVRVCVLGGEGGRGGGALPSVSFNPCSDNPDSKIVSGWGGFLAVHRNCRQMNNKTLVRKINISICSEN